MPIENFKGKFNEKQPLEELYQYDLHAVVYVPLYLAHAKYEIVPVTKNLNRFISEPFV